jgi:hypothetical protein
MTNNKYVVGRCLFTHFSPVWYKKVSNVKKRKVFAVRNLKNWTKLQKMHKHKQHEQIALKREEPLEGRYAHMFQ